MKMHISLEQFRAIPAFSQLTTDVGHSLMAKGQAIDICQSEFVYRNMDNIIYVYFILKGTVQIFRDTPNGHEITSDILIAGDCLNIEDVVGTLHWHTHNAKSLEAVQVLALPVKSVREIFKTHAVLTAHLMQGLSYRLNSAIIEAEHKATMSAAQVTACYLRRFCMLNSYNPQGFDLLYSRTLLASRLHMEPETLSRAIKILSKKGVRIAGNQVCFEDIVANAEFVCSDCSISEVCTANVSLNKINMGI